MAISVADELIKLKQLLDAGVLSDTEFNEQKKRLIDMSREEANSFIYDPNSIYSLTLTDVPDDRYEDTVKIVCSSRALSYDDGAAVVDSVPCVIRTRLKANECQSLEKRFTDVGCKVEIKIDNGAMAARQFNPTKDLRDNNAGNKITHVTCPYCHSTNVEKITLGKRVVKGYLWGAAAANTLVKEWHCKNCKSNF